jgi:heme/copper-type cytochrome/quinol oxidase subunit 4
MSSRKKIITHSKSGTGRGALLSVLGGLLGGGLEVVDAATFRTVVTDTILPLFDSAIGLIMTIATLVFVVGVVRFIYAAGDDKSRSEGRWFMVWGLIALLCMVAVWGIVRIIYDTFFG